MKRIKFLGIEIEYFFSFSRVKRLTFDLPDWADDTCVSAINMFGDEIPPTIKYYKGSNVFYIDLPKCKTAKMVSLSPMYDKVNKCRMKNRKIVVDIY